MKKVLTQEMEHYFIANAQIISLSKMCLKFGVSNSVCQGVFKKHNIIVSKQTQIKFRTDSNTGRISLTEEQSQFLKENYLILPEKTIARTLNKSSCCIRGRMKQLGLVVPKELAAERKAIGMFRKGQVPSNKGKKQVEYMTSEMIDRTKGTRFKKGNVPHNTHDDFVEVKRHDKRKLGKIYTLIKLPGHKILKYKHIHIWETQNNKKLTPGFNIIFKDGNSQNLELENLECISDAELMKKNSLHNYPKEITELIYLKGAINRQINKHKNDTI